MSIWLKRCVLLSTLGLVMLAGCSERSLEKSQERNSSNMKIIDVRTEEEYANGHLPDALLMPYDQISGKIGEAIADKNAEIVLYCRSGKRAETARTVLSELGYHNVINLGGVQDAAETLALPIIK